MDIATATTLRDEVLIVCNMNFITGWFKPKLQRKIEAEIDDWLKYRTLIYINSHGARPVGPRTIAIHEYTTDKRALEFKLIDAAIKQRNITIVGHNVLHLAECINNAHDTVIAVNLDLSDESLYDRQTVESRLFEAQINTEGGTK